MTVVVLVVAVVVVAVAVIAAMSRPGWALVASVPVLLVLLGHGAFVLVAGLTALAGYLIAGRVQRGQPTPTTAPEPVRQPTRPAVNPVPFRGNAYVVEFTQCECGGPLTRSAPLDGDPGHVVARGACAACGLHVVGMTDATTGEWAWFSDAPPAQTRRAS